MPVTNLFWKPESDDSESETNGCRMSVSEDTSGFRGSKEMTFKTELVNRLKILDAPEAAIHATNSNESGDGWECLSLVKMFRGVNQVMVGNVLMVITIKMMTQNRDRYLKQAKLNDAKLNTFGCDPICIACIFAVTLPGFPFFTYTDISFICGCHGHYADAALVGMTEKGLSPMLCLPNVRAGGSSSTTLKLCTYVPGATCANGRLVMCVGVVSGAQYHTT